jgi:hypothetical protein
MQVQCWARGAPEEYVEDSLWQGARGDGFVAAAQWFRRAPLTDFWTRAGMREGPGPSRHRDAKSRQAPKPSPCRRSDRRLPFAHALGESLPNASGNRDALAQQSAGENTRFREALLLAQLASGCIRNRNMIGEYALAHGIYPNHVRARAVTKPRLARRQNAMGLVALAPSPGPQGPEFPCALPGFRRQTGTAGPLVATAPLRVRLKWDPPGRPPRATEGGADCSEKAPALSFHHESSRARVRKPPADFGQ